MTQSGAKNRCEWLTNWAPAECIEARQAAVQELAKNRAWRESFFETTCDYRNQQASPEGLADWCLDGFHFAKHPWIQWLSWLSPVVLVTGIALIVVFQFQEYELGQRVGLGMVLGGAAVNFLLTMVIIGPIHDIFVIIETANRELHSLLNMIRAIRKL